MKRQNKPYYVLRKLNPKAQDIDKYLYVHGELGMWGAEWKLSSAILFNSKKEAEQYRATHADVMDYKVCEVDPRKQCLSERSCDNCSWGGTCPRHSS